MARHPSDRILSVERLETLGIAFVFVLVAVVGAGLAQAIALAGVG